ncbi:tachykinin-4 [Osmerus mordax]|uniref:tachykinin-4 n=1 Tax=Osmerus mordax TaxID=8014 RepID=UPI0035106B66
MEVLKCGVVVIAVLIQVYGALGSPATRETGDVWAIEKWQGDPSERGVIIRLADLIKRSKSQQFHGLMGRSSEDSQPVLLDKKRNKGEMFVGLMGRRSLSGEMEEEWDKQFY